MRLRQNMRDSRTAAHMTAEEAAEKIGVHVNALLRWEQGEAEPMGSNLLKLSKLYGKSPDYLLGVTSE